MRSGAAAAASLPRKPDITSSEQPPMLFDVAVFSTLSVRLRHDEHGPQHKLFRCWVVFPVRRRRRRSPTGVCPQVARVSGRCRSPGPMCVSRAVDGTGQAAGAFRRLLAPARGAIGLGADLGQAGGEYEADAADEVSSDREADDPAEITDVRVRGTGDQAE